MQWETVNGERRRIRVIQSDMYPGESLGKLGNHKFVETVDPGYGLQEVGLCLTFEPRNGFILESVQTVCISVVLEQFCHTWNCRRRSDFLKVASNPFLSF